MQITLDAITAAPAVVNNGRGDLVAANALGRALYSDWAATQDRTGDPATETAPANRGPGARGGS